MCGIEGRFSFRAELPVENTIVGRLHEFERHRGPDAEGADDQRVVPGHRLGNQPKTNVIFNGEIATMRSYLLSWKL